MMKDFFWIMWLGNKVAVGCTFQTTRVVETKTLGARQCGAACLSNSKIQCTHFSWASGVCSLRSGTATVDQAVKGSDPKGFCGFA